MEWDEFAKVQQTNAQSSGPAPSTFQFLVLKCIEHALTIVVVIIFVGCSISAVALYSNKQNEIGQWFLHSSELCLGVLLGLLKNKK
jgi:hypothetical protein